MKIASRLTTPAMIIVATLGVPGLTLAQLGGGSSDPMSNQKANQLNTLENQSADMIGDQEGIGGKYDVVPVRRGKLVDEKGGALDQVVKNKKGETLGTIEKLLKDTKTGKVEYAVIELADTKYQLPLQWSLFKQEKGKLVLNTTKNELYPTTSSIYSKDRSPEISHYMDQINKVREEPKGRGGTPSAEDPGARGHMGEAAVGGGGPSGTSVAPPGGAPGYEGDHPGGKQ
jgi:hypothetical protein